MSRSRPQLMTGPFVLASVANFLAGLSIHCYFHLPGYLRGLGADETLVGFIFGTMSGAAIVIRPFAGRIMDGAGRRVVIVAGAAINLLACALYVTVTDLGPWVFVVRTLHGFAEGALFSSLFTFAADIVPADRRTEGIGLFGVSGMLPMAFGGLLGDFVLSVADYRTLFVTTFAIAAATLLVVLPLREPKRPVMAAPSGFFNAMRQPDLIPLWFIGTMFAGGLTGFFTFLKSYVEQYDVGTVGTFFSFYAGGAVALRVVFGWVPDRYGHRVVLFPSLAFVSLALGATAIATASWQLAVAGVLAGLGHGYVFPILSAMAVERANPADRGSAMALLTAVFDAGILCAGPLLGMAADASSLRTMFWFAAGVPAIGALIFYFWDRRFRPTDTASLQRQPDC